MKFLIPPGLIVVIFITPFQHLFSQRTSNWVEKIDRGQYYEGTYSLQIRSEPIELISFYGKIYPYSFGSRTNLYAYFFSEVPSEYLIKAEEKTTNAYYWMESKPNSSQVGWNTFGPWAVDYELQRLKIRPQDLAIIVRLNGDRSPEVAPIILTNQQAPDPPKYYRAYFRLGVNISGGEFKVYKGKHPGIPQDQYLVQQGYISQKLGGNTFPITIRPDYLKNYSGWVTVELSVSELNKRKKYPLKFYFYHQPE